MSNKMALDALKFAEAALADIGDADREPGDDLAWCEARAAEALPKTRAAIAALQAEPVEEVEDLKRAYELLFKENAALRAEVERLAAQAAPTGLTEMGWIIDGATKGELAAYDQGCAECQQAVTKILDGKDTGAGTANPPWELLRRRLLALVAAQPSQAPVVQAVQATQAVRMPAVTAFNVGRFCLSEDDCIAQRIDFSAYERGVADAAEAFSRNT